MSRRPRPPPPYLDTIESKIILPSLGKDDAEWHVKPFCFVPPPIITGVNVVLYHVPIPFMETDFI